MRVVLAVAVLGALALGVAGIAACSTKDLEPIADAPAYDSGATAIPGDTGTTPSGSLPDGAAAAETGAPPLADGGTLPLTRKRGLAYGYNSDADLAALSAGIGWWYNWSAKPDDTLSKGYSGLGLEFAPMIWGGTFDTTQLAQQVPSDAKYLLTFNEPNFGSQSNLTPEAAAALWPKIQAFAQSRGMKIVSPGVNYCGSPCNDTNPFDWLQKFFAACPACRVDYVAMHWYACTKDALVSTLTQYEQTFSKPLWVTEVSCLDDTSKVNNADELAYMEDAVAVLEADPMVFRYAWYTGRSSGTPPVSVLATASGSLTPLGAKYLSLPH